MTPRNLVCTYQYFGDVSVFKGGRYLKLEAVGSSEMSVTIHQHGVTSYKTATVV
jgi:hypothetical protein